MKQIKIWVELDEETHSKFKSGCAKDRTTLKQKVRDMVSDYIHQDENTISEVIRNKKKKIVKFINERKMKSV